MWNKDITDVSIVIVLILTNLYYLHIVQYINAYTVVQHLYVITWLIFILKHILSIIILQYW